MGKPKKISKSEKERRAKQRQAQWEKDNPEAMFHVEQMRRDVERWSKRDGY